MRLYAAARFSYLCGGLLFVMMPFAVVVTAGVTINDGAVEKHRQHLLHRKLGCASMDANAQLVQ